MGAGAVILLFWTVVVETLYHKVFTVIYFDLQWGLFRELLTAFIIGMVLTAFTLYLWWLADIIVFVTGALIARKTANVVPVIVAVIIGVLIFVARIAI